MSALPHNSMAINYNSHTDAPFTYDTGHMMSHDSPRANTETCSARPPLSKGIVSHRQPPLRSCNK